jgi:hypothetical protein
MSTPCLRPATLIVLGLVLSTLANAAAAADLKITKTEATALTTFQTLHNLDRPTGVALSYQPPAGHVFWLVTLAFTPTWDEKNDTLSGVESDFAIQADGKPCTFVGSMSNFGAINTYVQQPYLYRPDDWQTTEPVTEFYRYLMVVPAGAKEASLQMAWVAPEENVEFDKLPRTKLTAPIKLTGNPRPFDINDYVDVQLRGVKMLPAVEEKDEDDVRRPVARIENLGGGVLQVMVHVSPKQATSNDGKAFTWNDSWLGLSFGRGGRAVCMGRLDYGKIVPYGGHTFEQKEGGLWDVQAIALYFAVPANLKSFDVTYMGHVVAKGQVPAAP